MWSTFLWISYSFEFLWAKNLVTALRERGIKSDDVIICVFGGKMNKKKQQWTKINRWPLGQVAWLEWSRQFCRWFSIAWFFRGQNNVSLSSFLNVVCFFNRGVLIMRIFSRIKNYLFLPIFGLRCYWVRVFWDLSQTFVNCFITDIRKVTHY